jgi:ribose-phosphate pyrophosphokinase
MSIFIPMPGNQPLAIALAQLLGGSVDVPETRHFPDGETYIRINAEVESEECVIVGSLDRPDDKFLPLAFIADALRDLGARRVGVVAPYLPYLRQDKRFNSGEAITSRTFARLTSEICDWLLTVDPHLHRYSSLAEVYTAQTHVIHAAPLLAKWVSENVENPLIVGPDSESEQWVSEVAQMVDAPYVIMQKTRLGDREVRVSLPDVSAFKDRRPVMLDDIVSSARTMIEACTQFGKMGISGSVCVAVHGLFAEDAYQRLKKVADVVVTSNAVQHETNQIDLAPLLVEGIRTALIS